MKASTDANASQEPNHRLKVITNALCAMPNISAIDLCKLASKLSPGGDVGLKLVDGDTDEINKKNIGNMMREAGATDQ